MLISDLILSLFIYFTLIIIIILFYFERVEIRTCILQTFKEKYANMYDRPSNLKARFSFKLSNDAKNFK